MIGDNTRKALEAVEETLKGIKTAFQHLAESEGDQHWKNLYEQVVHMTGGVVKKVDAAFDTVEMMTAREDDVEVLQCLDHEVEELNLPRACEAFTEAVIKRYPQEPEVAEGAAFSWSQWRERTQNWLEGLASAIGLLSKVAPGTAAGRSLDLLHKSLATLAGATSI